MSKPRTPGCGDGPDVHSYVATGTLGVHPAPGVTRAALAVTTYSTMSSTQGLQGIPERSAAE